MDQQLIATDLSRAWLLARMAYEGRKVINDDFIPEDRRVYAATLYAELGKDFNQFFKNLEAITICEKAMVMPNDMAEYLETLESTWVKSGTFALETFRDNLDALWVYAYDGGRPELSWLTR